MFKWVIELKFFGRSISNDEEVEKEIEIPREAIHLTDGVGQKFKGNHNSNCCIRLCESKIKSFRKVASIVATGEFFKLNSAVRLL